jgi:hypothetical protein
MISTGPVNLLSSWIAAISTGAAHSMKNPPGMFVIFGLFTPCANAAEE